MARSRDVSRLLGAETGLRRRFIFTCTEGQTTFVGADDNGATLRYIDREFTDVYLNGIKLIEADYTASDGLTITLEEAASADDELEVISNDSFDLEEPTYTDIEVSSINNGPVGGRRNMLYNGTMLVSQRGNATNQSSDGYYGPDRWRIDATALDQARFDISHVSDTPDGFARAYELEITTPETTLAATETLQFLQRIEGQDLQHLQYGTAGAQSVTLSFWVKSSVTGTYSVRWLARLDTTGTTNRSIGATYDINTANTWEKKTITFEGDTDQAILNDNVWGAQMLWALSAGSDRTPDDNTSWGANTSGRSSFGQTADVVSTNGATWLITGVQLEVGSTATSFEHRSFGEELALCQRYYWNSYGDAADVGGSSGDGALYAVCGPVTRDRYFTEIQFPTEMRAQPTLTYYGGRDGVADTAARVTVYNNDNLRSFTNAPIVSRKGFSGYFDTRSNDDNAVTFQAIADAEL